VEDDQGPSIRQRGAATNVQTSHNTVVVRSTLKGRRLYLRRLEQLARRMLADHNVSGTELSILIAGDRMVRHLNRQYRNIDRPTDVLAFPQDTPFGPPATGKLLGDVVVSADRADSQARSAGRPLRDELMLLVAHGVLHLLGYNHRGSRDTALMRAAEQAALERVTRSFERD